MNMRNPSLYPTNNFRNGQGNYHHQNHYHRNITQNSNNYPVHDNTIKYHNNNNNTNRKYNNDNLLIPSNDSEDEFTNYDSLL